VMIRLRCNVADGLPVTISPLFDPLAFEPLANFGSTEGTSCWCEPVDRRRRPVVEHGDEAFRCKVKGEIHQRLLKLGPYRRSRP
jgi:hypothetical protein